MQDGFARIVRKVRLLEKHLARLKVLRDDFVHRGREDDFVRSSYEDGPLVGMLRGKNPLFAAL